MKKVLIEMLAKFFMKIKYLYWETIYLRDRKKYNLNADFHFNGPHILLYGDGFIRCGSNAYVGGFSTIQAVKGTVVSVGQSCQISHNVRIYTESVIPDADFSKDFIPSKKADVIIHDYCWIGANVFISPGVNIGRNSVVGANSVVTKDIPENEIWGGVPAKFIRKKNN